MKFSPELAYFCLFLVSLWLSGTLFEKLLRCRLLGELLIGLLFGNLQVGTFLPADKTALILAGEVGILGLIFEAGLGTDLYKVVRAGPRAAMVAFIGTALPLLTGFGFIYLLLQRHQLPETDPNRTVNIVIEAMASGASLASTSIACAVSMVKQQGLLESPVGTLITTAAMLDDVASLILLGVVSGMGATGLGNGSEPAVGVMTVVQPILASAGVILVGFAGSVFVLKCMARMESKEAKEMQYSRERGADGVINNEDNADEEIGESNIRIEANTRTTRTRAMLLYGTFGPTIKLAVMIIVSLGYSILAEYVGSSRLLGAFVAGVFFSHSAPMRALYEEQITHKIQPVMSAIFFATIGFAIPLTKILDPVLFGWGAVYAVIATLSKMATAVVSPTSTSEENIGRRKARWVVATAMVARGELGLLMVQQALLQGLIGQAVMVVTTWSIVLCTLVGIGSLSFAMKGIVAQRSRHEIK